VLAPGGGRGSLAVDQDEFAGQTEGQGYGPAHDIYGDEYNLEFSDDPQRVFIVPNPGKYLFIMVSELAVKGLSGD
jgi:hypothetical protein